MMSNSLISLIQTHNGSSKNLKKILNSAAYKELPLAEQANTLLAIIKNFEGDQEILMSIIRELISKLNSKEFFKNPNFFCALISLIKCANKNSEILMQFLSSEHNDIGTHICNHISMGHFNWEQTQEFFVTIAENAGGNIETLQVVLEQIINKAVIYSCIESIPGIVTAVINCANGNVMLLEIIIQGYNELRLNEVSTEQQKSILSVISSTIDNVNIKILESIIDLARSLGSLDLKEILTILAKRTDKEVKALAKIIDCAHECLPSQQQKDFLIDLIKITNMNQAVLSMIAEQAQYLLSPYGDEVLKYLEDTTKVPAQQLEEPKLGYRLS